MHSANDQVIFATAGYDHTIRFWEPKSGKCYRILQHKESQVNCMAIYPDKTLLATGGYQHVAIYDTMSNNQHAIYNLEGTVKNTVSIGFQVQGDWMYTAGEDKTLKIWDMKSRHINCLNVFNHLQPITCVSLHPNQIDFFIGDDNGNLIRWDIRTSRSDPILSDTKSSIRCISINQEGTMMAACNNEGDCYLWNLNGGFGDSVLRILPKDTIKKPHKRYTLKCLFSPDSTRIATSSADGTAKIHTTNDFKLLTECKDPNQSWIWDLAFTCDSDMLITASSDKSDNKLTGISRLWSVETGAIIKDFVGHQKPIVCLAFSDTKIIK